MEIQCGCGRVGGRLSEMKKTVMSLRGVMVLGLVLCDGKLSDVQQCRRLWIIGLSFMKVNNLKSILCGQGLSPWNSPIYFWNGQIEMTLPRSVYRYITLPNKFKFVLRKILVVIFLMYDSTISGWP
jgi:hypothetical protein